MSAKRAIYEAFRDALAEATTTKDLVKHFELWNNQLVNDDLEEARAFPAVFMEFAIIEWLDSGVKIQQGQVDVVLHCVFEKLATEALEVLDDVDLIAAVIQTTCGFVRVSEVQDTNHDMCIDWQITFRANVKDDALDQEKGLRETTVSTLEINKDLDIDNTVVRTGDGDFTT